MNETAEKCSFIPGYNQIWKQLPTSNIRKYGSPFYVGMGRVKNGVLYLRYSSNFVITKAECYKAFTHKNLHYSIVERLPLSFLNVVKSVPKVSVFFLLILLSFFFLSHHVKLKNYRVYMNVLYMK